MGTESPASRPQSSLHTRGLQSCQPPHLRNARQQLAPGRMSPRPCKYPLRPETQRQCLCSERKSKHPFKTRLSHVGGESGGVGLSLNGPHLHCPVLLTGHRRKWMQRGRLRPKGGGKEKPVQPALLWPGGLFPARYVTPILPSNPSGHGCLIALLRLSPCPDARIPLLHSISTALGLRRAP